MASAEIDAAAVADRLWRAYVPYLRGRNSSGDLTSMLAILVLAQFVDSVGKPEDEFVKRWNRAVAEAGSGISPLMDLRAALVGAVEDRRFPLPDPQRIGVGLLVGGVEPDDFPWVAAFLTALNSRPPGAEVDLAEVCALFLERRDREDAISDEEFYTPRAVSRLLVDLVRPRAGDRILDPACGVGEVLATAVRSIAGDGRLDGATLEGCAVDSGNPSLAMLNLAIHGVDQPVVRVADSLSQLRSRSNVLFDKVLGNPPFNQRIENAEHEPWPFGPPSASNANLAWLQLAWKQLSANGIATMIMPPSAAWSPSRDVAIRRAMVERGALLGVVALPPNLFAHTSVAVHLWILVRDKARQLPAGSRDAVLFIDASRLGTPVPRRPDVLTEVDAARIVDRFSVWRRSPRETSDERGFSRSVTHEEILANAANLDPRTYVGIEGEPRAEVRHTSLVVDELRLNGETVSRSGTELVERFTRCESVIPGGTEVPRLTLNSVVGGVAGSSGLLFAGPSGSLIRADDYVAKGGTPVVMPKDLTADGLVDSGIKRITDQQAERMARFRLHRGDVVLARRGELGRCAVVHEQHVGWICGTGCFVLRPPSSLDPHYFAAYLRSREARAWLDAHSTGTVAMKTISLDVLRELPIALPDLGTQYAVAEVMIQLDEHERLLREQLALTREIRDDALGDLLNSKEP